MPQVSEARAAYLRLKARKEKLMGKRKQRPKPTADQAVPLFNRGRRRGRPKKQEVPQGEALCID